MVYSDKAPRRSPVVVLAKFAPIVEPGLQHTLVDAVAFPLYPRHAQVDRDIAIWLAREVFDKLSGIILLRKGQGTAKGTVAKQVSECGRRISVLYACF
ncbi:hypothetical protein TNCV_1558291 [Trichonephila clavipes]|uniref:Uncharacterized protein n=1 Tax=Trichonephila clavipes TaxID=2585209 RepID=A0A8X6V0M3_TRICX|nr:hypothetical protein TNCV_1558291 [Trichonephila clavipes]